MEHLHRYAVATEFVKNKIVLDIACGVGYGSYLLAAYALKVTGIDINKESIEVAKKKYSRPQLSFLNGDVENIPVENASFDVVISFETLEHITNHDKMLEEIKRVIKPGGLLLISTPDKLIYSEKANHHNPFHKKELYKDEFELLICRYFKNNQLIYQSSGTVSIIMPQIATGSSATYTGDFDHISKIQGIAAPFLVAIASDNFLPPLSFSIFKSEALLPLILKEQSDAIRQTISYRLGHMLLKPFKLIKAAFLQKKHPKLK